jgi:hypothetical protein
MATTTVHVTTVISTPLAYVTSERHPPEMPTLHAESASGIKILAQLNRPAGPAQPTRWSSSTNNTIQRDHLSSNFFYWL